MAILVDGGLGADSASFTSSAAGALFSFGTPGAQLDAGAIPIRSARRPSSARSNRSCSTQAQGAAVDSLTDNGTSASNQITVAASDNNTLTVNQDGRPTITLDNTTAGSWLTIDAGDGDDIVSITQPAAAWTITSVVVSGTNPVASDKLIVVGSSSNDDFACNPTAATNQVQVTSAAVTTNYTGTGFEQVVLDGQGSTGTSLNVTGAAAGSTFALHPLRHCRLGPGRCDSPDLLAKRWVAPITLAGGTGTDTLLLAGSIDNDVVVATGTSLNVNGRVYALVSQQVITLNLIDGNDAATISTHSRRHLQRPRRHSDRQRCVDLQRRRRRHRQLCHEHH